MCLTATAIKQKTPVTEFFLHILCKPDTSFFYLGKEKCSANQIIKIRETPHIINMANK